MKLEETKIVVVDDRKEDVEKLLGLLNKKGVPFNYYYENADKNNLPEQPLKNVRLVFLDFVLGTDGQPEKTKIATLMNVLAKILALDNGPYIIMAWTLHNGAARNSDLISPFKVELFRNSGIPKPVAIIDLDKANIMRCMGDIDKKIKKEFNGNNIFEIIFGWECNGRIALSGVIKTITDISSESIGGVSLSLDDYSCRLRKAVEKNMRNFAVANSGQNLEEGNKILVDSQLPLCNIFQDQLEMEIKKQTPFLKNLSKRIYSAKRYKYIDSETAQMNTFFLFSSRPEPPIRPGNIYEASSILKKLRVGNRIKLEKTAFYKIKKIKGIYSSNGNSPLNLKIKEFTKRIIPILIEATPECDYAQKNWKGAKFIFGVLWPYKFADGTKTEEYLAQKDSKIFPKFLMKFNNEMYFFMLHSDYQCIFPLSPVKNVEPILRARKELLTDIQHWIAMHASRPGKTEFH